MIKIDEVIIVEGKSDLAFLSSFIDADILTCNGSAIDGFDMEYLRTLAKNRGVIILTDPDYPGNRIRNEIEKQIKDAKHAFVRKEVSIKHHKVGVAESSKDEVIKALLAASSCTYSNKGTLCAKDLYALHIAGDNSSLNKSKVIKHYNLGVCSSKTLLKRLNMLGVSLSELEKIVYDSK